MNIIMLAGRVGNDPEGKTTNGGGMVCRIRLATSHVYYKDERKHETTDWHTLVSFGNRAESMVRHIKRGDGIVVTGRMTYDEWEDKDGNKRVSPQVLVEKWEFGQGSAKGPRSKGNEPKLPPEPNFNQSFNDDAIPF